MSCTINLRINKVSNIGVTVKRLNTEFAARGKVWLEQSF